MEEVFLKGSKVKRQMVRRKLYDTRDLYVMFVLWGITVLALFPIFSGHTFGTVAQQMLAQYPWRVFSDLEAGISGIKNGYPQTDFADGFYCNWVFLTDALKDGILPLWFPFSFMGSRTIETGLLGFYYPIRLLIAPILSPINQHNFILLFHLFGALFSMYWFLRHLSCSRLGSVFGAIVWGLNGHVIFYMIFQYTLILATWFPLTLLSASLAVEKKSVIWAVICGLSTGLMAFAGYANYLYVSVIVLAIWYVSLTARAALREKSIGRAKNALQFFCLPCLSAVVALAVSAAYWLPFIDLLNDVARISRSIDVQIDSAIPFKKSLRGLYFPKSMKGPVWGQTDTASFLYVTPVALIFACFASLRKSRFVFFLFSFAVGSFLFAIGLRPIIALGHFLLPGFGSIHPFSIGPYLFTFSIAMLSAIGLTEFQRYPFKSIKCTKITAYSIPVLIFLSLLSFVWLLRISQPIQPAEDSWLFPSTPLILRMKELESQNHSRFAQVHINSENWTPPIFFGRSNVAVGLRSAFGYESLLETNSFYFNLSLINRGRLPDFSNKPMGGVINSLANDHLPLDLLSNFSIRFLVTPPNSDLLIDGSTSILNDRIMSVYAGPDGTIWEIKDALPRVFLAENWYTLSDDKEALSKILSHDFNPQLTSVISGLNSFPINERSPSNFVNSEINREAQFIDDGINQLIIRVKTSRPSLLIINDTWAPGWRASVNKVPVQVLRTNYISRGVMVPAGVSEVHMSYRPWPLVVGLYVSIFSLSGVFLYLTYMWGVKIYNSRN